jgi:hypothetical protein
MEERNLKLLLVGRGDEHRFHSPLGLGADRSEEVSEIEVLTAANQTL